MQRQAHLVFKQDEGFKHHFAPLPKALADKAVAQLDKIQVP